MDVILKLSDKKPLFQGLTRSVFEYEHNSNILIKVPTIAWRNKISASSRFRKLRKAININSPNFRELREYIRYSPNTSEHLKHLLQITGLVATDLGWGLLVKAERSQDGNYARPLGAYLNVIKTYRKEIDEFVAWVKETKIVCYDLKFDNILLTWRDGKAELVLIDGIGESGVFQKRKWFSKHNHSRNIKELDEFLDALKPLLGVK